MLLYHGIKKIANLTFRHPRDAGGSLKMNNALSLKTQIGYGVASLADSGPYNFVLTYFMFFLTNIAGISPSTAGTISLVSIIFNSVFTVLVGCVSDQTQTKHGRRKPFMAISALPLGASIFLMFFNIGLDGNIKVLYFMAISLFFWLSFSFFYIPYSALGAELSSDYHERTRLRNYARIFSSFGNIGATAVPLLIISLLVGIGKTQEFSWSCAGLFVGAFSAASILATLYLLRNHKTADTGTGHSPINIKVLLMEYQQLLTIRPYLYLLLTVVFFTSGATIFNADMIYFMKYKIGLSEGTTSALYLTMALAGLAMTPVFAVMAAKIGKSKALMVTMFFSGTMMIVYFVAGVDSFPMAMVHILTFSIGFSSYWQLILSVVYDISEVDEFKYGRRREGSIMSLTTVTLMIMPAVAMQVFGFILKLSGYSNGAAVQGANAVKGIELSFTIVPAVLFILAGICFMLYPLNQRRFQLLKEALSLKIQGKTYSTQELEKVIK
jgi:GPH family glycoside/pentoside/hexuronide:cation symporter